MSSGEAGTMGGPAGVAMRRLGLELAIGDVDRGMEALLSSGVAAWRREYCAEFA